MIELYRSTTNFNLLGAGQLFELLGFRNGYREIPLGIGSSFGLEQ